MMRRNLLLPGLIGLLSLAVSACGGKDGSLAITSPSSFDSGTGLTYDMDRQIAETSYLVNPRFRHTYHYMAPVGWINDPNGFGFYQNKIHLFSQSNAYAPVWGGIHWGHQTSTDFIKWKLVHTALAPDEKYDAGGCFSGTSLEYNGTQYLYYTSIDGTGDQNQSVAYSTDGLHYTKSPSNPIITGAMLPKGLSHSDFRDPKVFMANGRFYALLVCKKTDNSAAKVIVQFSSDNPDNDWQYDGIVLSSSKPGGMFECPDYETIDGTDVILASAQNLSASGMAYFAQNGDAQVYATGTYEPVSHSFVFDKTADSFDELDKGFDFYAAQTMKVPDGRTVLTAWMSTWSTPRIFATTDNWWGAYVLPRELSVRAGHVYQAPVREIANYYTKQETAEALSLAAGSYTPQAAFRGNRQMISFDIDVANSEATAQTGIKVFANANGTTFTSVYYDRALGGVVFSREHSDGIPTVGESGDLSYSGKRIAEVEPVNGKIHLQLFLDVSSLEVFINDGYYTMTGYTASANDNVGFFSENGSGRIENIEQAAIEVD